MQKEIKPLASRLRELGAPVPFTAKDLMQTMMDVLGETKMPQHLGAGTFAEVYWPRSNRKVVLKFTTDASDAHASELIRRRPHKSFVKIHKVYEIIPYKLFAIVAEKLQPLSSSEMQEWGKVIPAITMDDDDMEYDLLDKLMTHGLSTQWLALWRRARAENIRKREEAKEEDEDDFAEDEEFDDEILRLLNAEFLELDDSIFETLQTWAKELESRNIVFADIHAKNIMKRGRQPVIIEFGAGQAPQQTLERLDISVDQ